MAYIRLNGLGNLAGSKSAARGVANDQAMHGTIMKMLPEFNSIFNKIRSKAAQAAGAGDSARRAIQQAESELYSGDSFSFSFSDSGGTADVDDALADIQALVEKATSIMDEVKAVNIPSTWNDIGMNTIGMSYGALKEKLDPLLSELKSIDNKFNSVAKKITTAAQLAQRQIAQAQQRRQQEEARVRAQEQAEIRRQQQEEARQRAAEQAEQRKIQAEYAAEQRRAQLELQREQQRAQMEAQYAAQQAAIEQAKMAAEQARLQAELQASMPPMPAMPAYQAPQAPLYSPATTTTDAGYVDPSSIFASLLPPSPQAYNVPQEQLYQASAGSDWIEAESQAGGWNQGGAMWGMSGLGDVAPTPGTPKTGGTSGSTAAPKGTTPTRVPGGATKATVKAPTANKGGNSGDGILSVKNAIIAAALYAAYRFVKR